MHGKWEEEIMAQVAAVCLNVWVTNALSTIYSGEWRAKGSLSLWISAWLAQLIDYFIDLINEFAKKVSGI